MDFKEDVKGENYYIDAGETSIMGRAEEMHKQYRSGSSRWAEGMRVIRDPGTSIIDKILHWF